MDSKQEGDRSMHLFLAHGEQGRGRGSEKEREESQEKEGPSLASLPKESKGEGEGARKNERKVKKGTSSPRFLAQGEQGRGRGSENGLTLKLLSFKLQD